MSPTLVAVGQLLLGALVLYLGAEWLVKGAAGLARAIGLPPLVVGLTVVAYGTSAPEMTVGVASALDGRGAIALGNSIGSNIANLGLILGMTILIAPPRVDGGVIRREIPILLLSTMALPLLLVDGALDRLDGAVMVVAAIVYTWWMIRKTPSAVALAPAETLEDAAETAGAPPGTGKLRLGLIALVGLALLIGGGKLFVDGAVQIARAVGLSERVVGLTIVAIGTSLPELAASLVAALRGHGDIAVGNVLGSNIFNVLAILGVSALVRPLDGALSLMVVDLAFLGGITLMAAVSMRAARALPRMEGAVFVMAYVGFLIALLLAP
jgi:cation:H+ antiporter